MSSREREFLDVYQQTRVEDQRGYYERTAAKFQAAHQQLLLISALMFGISGAVALLSGSEHMPWTRGWALLAALLPAVTAAISAYEGLFAFERIAKLYRDASRNLRRVGPPVLSHTTNPEAAIAAYVADVERIFERERGQWGQLGSEPASASAGKTAAD